MALKDTLSSVRAAVKAHVVAAVAAGVPVYDYRREIKDEATRKSLGLDSSSDYHLWMVSLNAEAPTRIVTRGANSEAFFRFDLHGWLRVNDSEGSEKSLDAEACDIIDRFRTDKHLGGLAIDAWTASGSGQAVSRVAGGWVTFTSVVCHYARIDVTVRVVLEC